MGPLNISLNTGSAKTAFPLIADGMNCEFRLTNLSKVTAEKGDTLKWEFDLVNPTTDSDGATLLPGGLGSKQFVNIQLYAKADAKDPTWFVKKISTYMDALLGTADAGNAKGKPVRPDLTDEIVAQLIGKTLFAKVKISTYEGTSRNEFAQVFFPGDIKA